jgi:hypothetical protein
VLFSAGWPPDSRVCIQQRRTHYDHSRRSHYTWGDVPCVWTLLPSDWPLPVSQFALTANCAALFGHSRTLAVSIKSKFCYYEFRNESHVNIKQVRKCAQKIGKVHSLEGSEILKVFCTPHHGRWLQHVVSLITTAQRNSGLTSLLLERDNKRNGGMQGYCCHNVIQGHCCEQIMTSVLIITMPQQLPRSLPFSSSICLEIYTFQIAR